MPHAHVVILIGASPQSLRPDEREGYDQAHAIAESLQRLGFTSEIMQLGSDVSILKTLQEKKPFFIFNLVEELEGQCRLAALVPTMLESLELPFSGASALSYAMTGDKLWTKRMLKQASLPTPAWSKDGLDMAGDELVIVKSVFEDASFGIDNSSVMKEKQAAIALREKSDRFGGAWFAERYVEGREFNVSLLSIDGRLKVLPIAEMAFFDYPPDKPRIMDYGAKWDEQSFAYNHTKRIFINESDELASVLRKLAIAAWKLFALKGYARIDFRLDADNKPYILEVNANPSIALDSGFVAAAIEGGLSFDNLISLMLPSTTKQQLTIKWREQVIACDILAIKHIIGNSGFFNEEETAIAVELAELGLNKGTASGYYFIIAESEGKMLGYACYGRIMSTQDRYDLYWIAVDSTLRRQGLGAQILKRVEELVLKAGGRRLYLQTAGRPFYAPTRAFYFAAGYIKAGQLPDYYSTGDDLYIFMKELV